MILFGCATLAPLGLLLVASLAGGLWIAAAIAMITVFTWAADRLARQAAEAVQSDAEFPTGNALAVVLVIDACIEQENNN